MKYLLTIAFVSVFGFLQAQISEPIKPPASVTVGKIAPLGGFVAELSYYINEGDTTYILTFNNMKYKHIDAIESVAFSGISNSAEGLYKMFKSVFSKENKSNKDYIVQFTLGKESVAISNVKSMGITSAMFTCKNAFFTLTEKQVNKLFGK
jgi:hypothetical protein